MMIGGGDGFRRVNEYGNAVARQTERRALAEGKGHASQHRNRGMGGIRRLLRRLRNRKAVYECTCPTPPAPGERHRLACELSNEPA